MSLLHPEWQRLRPRRRSRRSWPLLIPALASVLALTRAAGAQDLTITISSLTTIAGDQVLGECGTVAAEEILSSFFYGYGGTQANCTLSNGTNSTSWFCEDNLPCSGSLPLAGGVTYTTSGQHWLFGQAFCGDPECSFVLFDDSLGFVVSTEEPFFFYSCSGGGQACSIFPSGEDCFPDCDPQSIFLGQTAESEVTVKVTPAAATLVQGQTQAFAANVPVQWTLGPSGLGRIDAAGHYTAPATIDGDQTDTVVACSTSDTSNCATAEVSLVSLAVSITENNVEVLPGQAHIFEATVTPGTVPQGVTWSLVSNPGNAAKLADKTANPVTFTANLPPPPSSSTVLLQACSNFVPSQCSPAVTVNVPAVAITIGAAANPYLAAGGTQDLITATVVGPTTPADTAVTWQPIAATAGTLTPNGSATALYQAPGGMSLLNAPAQVVLTACLTAAKNLCSPAFTLTVVPPVAFTLAPLAWPSGQGTPITLTGTGFGTQPQVTFNGDPLIQFIQPTLTVNANNSVLSGIVVVPPSAGGEIVTLTLTDTTSPLAPFPATTSTPVTVAPVQVTDTLFPASITLQEGAVQGFTSTVNCKTASGGSCTIPTAVQCSVNPPVGTMNPQTCVYTANGGVAAQTVVQGKACLLFNLTACGSTTITLTPTAVAVAPASAQLTAGRTAQFSASVSGNTVTTVSWSIQPAVGSISTTGLYTAPATITSPQTVTVSACSTVNGTRCGRSVVTLVPLPQLTPASLSFGAQAVGTTSSPQTVVLSNPNSAPLTSIVVGASGDFTPTSTCTTTLAANASCNISVVFSPTAGGNPTGALTVTHSAANSPQSVALSGTPTSVTLSPASLVFPDQVVGASSTTTQTVTLTNHTTAALAFSGLNVLGDFVATHNCPASLAAGAACTLTVRFAPITTGLRTGSLSVANQTTIPASVTLSGTGLPLIPSLAAVAPATVTAGSTGFTLIVTGSSFARGAEVLVNGSPRPTTFVASPQLPGPPQLRAAIPASDVAGTGALSITVLNPGTAGGASSPLPLTVTTTPIPLIGSLSPVRALAGGAPRTLTLSGSNFPPDAVVLVNSTPHQPTLLTPDQITVTLAGAEIAASAMLNVSVASTSEGASNTALFLVFKYGDLNLDNIVSVTDLSILANYLAGNITLLDTVPADLNCDGIVNATDLGSLANFLAGNVTLPTGTGCPQ